MNLSFCLLCCTLTYTWVNVLTLRDNHLKLLSSQQEDKENCGAFHDLYNKLICQEDFSADDQALYQNQKKQQVRPESSMNHYKLLTVGLAALAVILLAINIGLGVYYSKLTTGYNSITNINEEIARLQTIYNAAIQGRDHAQMELAMEKNVHQQTIWEIEHQEKRNKDYEKQIDVIKVEISALKSHIPMIMEGCRHCLPGWTFMNSVCYYFSFSDTALRRSWNQARQFCTNQGGDLAVIDSVQKNVAITNLINSYHDTSRSIYQSGFWFGLRDIEEEGTWKWLNGRRLSEGYWNDGEPNNNDNEDCAATYPRNNPFKAWNDAPCTHNLKWICEMAPMSGGFF